MKGVIFSINPEAKIVDLTHSVPPQDVNAGALALSETTSFFPENSIHVAVVDPGVGTRRAIVYAEIGSQRYVAPDNGLLTRLADSNQPTKIVHITNRQWWREEVSRTFHGRDIMAPVAAHLSKGLSPDQLGTPAESLVSLDWPEVQKVANQIQGEVVEVDSFGNLITNITKDMLEGVPTDESVTVSCDEHETQGIYETYGDQPAMTLIALIGSNDCLELAIVDENASIMLGVRAGTPLRVSW